MKTPDPNRDPKAEKGPDESSTQKADQHAEPLAEEYEYPFAVHAPKPKTEDGVMFISIDDHEQAALKLLCDQVFGEENFVANIMWKRKKKYRATQKLSVQGEHILRLLLFWLFVLCFRLVGPIEKRSFARTAIRESRLSVR